MSVHFSIQDFSKKLEHYLNENLVPSKGCPIILKKSIIYSSLLPGKRIRPQILHASAQMLSVQTEITDLLSIALELIHCFSLIHDDLPCMDDDDMRRGQPSNHKVFGEAQALLAGDALIPLAIEAVLKTKNYSKIDSTLNSIASICSSIGAQGMIGGQFHELHIEKLNDPFELKEIQRKKTGELFRLCTTLPLYFSDINNSQLEKLLIHSGYAYGECFQCLDDIEDSQQDTVEFNKNTALIHNSIETSKNAILNLNLAVTELKSLNIKSSENLIRIFTELSFKLESKLNESKN